MVVIIPGNDGQEAAAPNRESEIEFTESTRPRIGHDWIDHRGPVAYSALRRWRRSEERGALGAGRRLQHQLVALVGLVLAGVD